MNRKGGRSGGQNRGARDGAGTVRGKDRAEKRQTAYLFSCAGGILWVVPAVSSLFIGIMTDGMSPGFALAIAALVLGIPNSLFAMAAYRKKSGRAAVIALDGLLIALHLTAAVFIRTWYVILSPALILLIVMIAVSDVIANH